MRRAVPQSVAPFSPRGFLSTRSPALAARALAWVVPLEVWSSLEAEVLERLGRPAVQGRCLAVVAPARGEVALRGPRGRAVRAGRELGQRVIGRGQRRLGVVEPVLIEQRAA